MISRDPNWTKKSYPTTHLWSIGNCSHCQIYRPIYNWYRRLLHPQENTYVTVLHNMGYRSHHTRTSTWVPFCWDKSAKLLNGQPINFKCNGVWNNCIHCHTPLRLSLITALMNARMWSKWCATYVSMPKPLPPLPHWFELSKSFNDP